jgi:hypothetical protein
MAYFEVNYGGGGRDTFQGDELCLGVGLYSYNWPNPGRDGGYFPNQTRLCNYWQNILGKPCETVHS